MRDDDRRLLTEFIHGRVIFDVNFFGFTGQGDMRPIPTFTTWGDLGSVKTALVKAGKWESFFDRVWSRCGLTWGYMVADYLFVPERFCQLAADFLRESKELPAIPPLERIEREVVRMGEVRP
jgi:hypothetical protein